MRFQYYLSVSQLTVTISGFNDLSSYANNYELISNLNCAVIFVFMFNIINHVASLSDDFKIISKALVSVNIINLVHRQYRASHILYYYDIPTCNSILWILPLR